EKTSTNPVATIFAWSGALKKRGELDGNKELEKFGTALEEATMQTINDGVMTGDLAALMEPKPEAVTSEDFIAAIRERLAKKL
ncbi:MAG: NADP-dependent isocitrate dehydrogenase, partial [Oscillospiraceae bacterium]|nr:NADP-dependent isocitrate dehydrogenase [Oscillospiraceae bacterium]